MSQAVVPIAVRGRVLWCHALRKERPELWLAPTDYSLTQWFLDSWHWHVAQE